MILPKIYHENSLMFFYTRYEWVNPIKPEAPLSSFSDVFDQIIFIRYLKEEC